jgi:hypothetical protein
MRKIFTTCLTLLLPLCSQAQSTSSADSNRFNLRVGVFLTDVDGGFGLVRKGEDDPPIDIDDLSLSAADNDDTAYLGLLWKVNEKWRAEFSYFRTDYNSSFIADEVINSGDQTIPVGAEVNTGLSVDFLIAQVGYSFYDTDTTDMGLGLGFHFVNLESFVTAGLGVDDRSDFNFDGGVDFLAPWPNFYGYFYHTFNDRIAARGYAGYFSMAYEEIDGKLSTVNVSVDYSLGESFFIGLGYSIINVDVTEDQGRTEQIYDLDFTGPQISVGWRF